MSNNESMSSFYEIFDSSLPRLAPGDALSTKKAIQLLMSERDGQGNLPPDTKLRVLDIGCGNGSQTIELAKQIDSTILAVDNHQPFLEELQRRAEAEGVAEKIEPRLGDMFNLGQEEEGSFDLIWSEGAFFIMGVRDALKMCHRLLVPHGLLGMTEMAWFKPDPPTPCQQFFDDVHSMMVDVDANLAMMEECGFEVLGHFSLPESSWWDHYYHPLEARLRLLHEKYTEDPEKLALIESIQMEIEIYRDYSSYYGYEFYLLKQR